MCMYVCVHVRTVGVHIVGMYVHAHVCVCVHTQSHMHICMHMYVCVHISVCMCIVVLVFCRLKSCLRSRALIRLQYYSTLVTRSLLITSHQLGALLGTVQLLDTSDLEGQP